MPESKPETPPLTFVGIGEVLFDVFENGKETLGGAPLNFAVHVHQLASRLGVGQGIIVSSINSDTRGYKIIEALESRHISTRYIEKDGNHSTGVVSVYMQNGEPAYQIEAEAAWDYISDKPELKKLAGQCSAICFGSLAQRSSVSRSTIRSFLENSPPKAIRLYDVNLRQNTLTGEVGYSQEIIGYSCQTAVIIKANQSELFQLFDILEISCPLDTSIEGIKRKMEILLEKFPAKTIIVTRGDQGTLALNNNREFDLTEPRSAKGTPNPVGAGDACSAGILFGLTLGWDIHTTMKLANRMGADVASHPSATPPLSDETLKFAQKQLNEKL
jgi:fructokinase